MRTRAGPWRSEAYEWAIACWSRCPGTNADGPAPCCGRQSADIMVRAVEYARIARILGPAYSADARVGSTVEPGPGDVAGESTTDSRRWSPIRSVTQPVTTAPSTSWQQHLRAIGRSEGTMEQYSSHVVRFLRGRSAYAATLDDVEEWMAGHRWAPATRRSAASSWRRSYRWALRHPAIVEPT